MIELLKITLDGPYRLSVSPNSPGILPHVSPDVTLYDLVVLKIEIEKMLSSVRKVTQEAFEIYHSEDVWKAAQEVSGKLEYVRSATEPYSGIEALVFSSDRRLTENEAVDAFAWSLAPEMDRGPRPEFSVEVPEGTEQA